MGINLTDVNALGEVWGSESLKAFAANMNKDTSNANVGDLRGNRMFYTSDYMVSSHQQAATLTFGLINLSGSAWPWLYYLIKDVFSPD